MVVAELNPAAKQGDLLRALEPVVDRLAKQFNKAKARWRAAAAGARYTADGVT